MPTYEYKCDACGIVFDRFQHFSEDPLETCPECGGVVHRVIQPVGIIFKGNGFYITDNRADTSSLMPKREKDKKSEDTSSNGDGKEEESESA
ncbi:MAG: FmdB family zinc ribbon protein [Anaerolineales bacterium]